MKGRKSGKGRARFSTSLSLLCPNAKEWRGSKLKAPLGVRTPKRRAYQPLTGSNRRTPPSKLAGCHSKGSGVALRGFYALRHGSPRPPEISYALANKFTMRISFGPKAAWTVLKEREEREVRDGTAVCGESSADW